MSLHKPRGPNPEVFKKLKEQLPSYREEVEKKRLLKGQTPVADMVPKKVCEVCGKGFDWGPIKGPIPELAVCDRCQAKLDEGFAALKADNRYAFIKSKSLADWAGQIHIISPSVMDNVQRQHLGEVITAMLPEENKPNEPTDAASNGGAPELN